MHKAIRNVQRSPGTEQSTAQGGWCGSSGMCSEIHTAETAEDTMSAAPQIGFNVKVSKTRHVLNSRKNGNELKEIEINGQKY
jgi:hypothetical protein